MLGTLHFISMPALYGIIGYPLSHSFSPAYFKKKFSALGIDALFESFPIASADEFPALLAAHPGLLGLSVTIPYKELIIRYLDDVDNRAQEAGAVNCIKIKDGLKKGYNTDIAGFEQSLVPLLSQQHDRALVLGTGGASKAVAYVLGQLGIPFKVVSRSKRDNCLTYDEVTGEIISAYKLIINTTPAGMYPNINDAPALPYSALGAQHLLYDLIYNPVETKFLRLGKEHGCQVKNGYEMLHLQADASWEIWTSPGF